MKVVIAGGTTFDSMDHMNLCLDDMVDEIETIVSGRGYGADALAEVFAIQHGIDKRRDNWEGLARVAYQHKVVVVVVRGMIHFIYASWDRLLMSAP